MASPNDKYIRGKVLGKGSFGSAILVTSKADGKQHVIKEIDISRMPRAERESAELEAKVGTFLFAGNKKVGREVGMKPGQQRLLFRKPG